MKSEIGGQGSEFRTVIPACRESDSGLRQNDKKGEVSRPRRASQKTVGFSYFLLHASHFLLLTSYFLLLSLNSKLSTLNFLYAIEIPLEGFGKTTNIAYVNMHKIFEAFPETEKARVELNKLIEEKKAGITEKKEEVARLKAEIEYLRKQLTALLPSSDIKISENKAVSLKEGTTETAPTPLTPLTLPEGSPLGFIFSSPQKSTETPIVETSTAPVVSISTSAPSILPGIPSPEPQLKEKESLLSLKEADLEAFIGTAEEEVRGLEEGKTMTLLARIYKSLEEIAVKEGYSIVVDKENILYGEGTVDLTQNVIWRLTAPGKKER